MTELYIDPETLPPPTVKISPKRNQFSENYWLHRNAAKAAREAGYSEKTARQQGSRLLTFVDVQSRIRELDDWHRERLVWTKDRAIEQLMADHQIYRLDPKSAGAATKALEMILKLEGLLDPKGDGKDDSATDFAKIMEQGAAAFDAEGRTLN